MSSGELHPLLDFRHRPIPSIEARGGFVWPLKISGATRVNTIGVKAVQWLV